MNAAPSWITSEEFCGLEPLNVFHRQLDRSAQVPMQDTERLNRHILFRKSFRLESVPEKAPLRVSADDCYKLYANGAFVAQGPAPGYPSRTFFNLLDVAPYLRPGRNVVAVHTYYQGLVNRVWVSADRRHGLWMDLEDGSGNVLARSDGSFLCRLHTGYSACGTVGYLTQFLERYDASAPEVGFEDPDFDDSAWAPARVRTHADYVFAPDPVPVLEVERVAPVKTEERPAPAPGGSSGEKILFVDFGAIYIGNLSLRAAGPRGAEITLRFGQELREDGSVRHDMRCNCDYVEYFRLSGRPDGDVLRQFDYKSFRYAELVLPGGVGVDLASVALVARHRPFALRAACRFSDPRSLAVWNLCAGSFRYGVQETIQDCMDREKGYYMGDGCYTMWAYYLLTRDVAMLRKFVDDFLASSFISEGLMTCACCSFMQEIAEFPFYFVLLVWEYAAETGDWEFVRPRYARLARVMDDYRARYAEPDGLLSRLDKWCVTEWPRNCRDGYDVDVEEGKVCEAKHNVINAWYVGAVRCMNKLAAGLGLPPYADEAAYKRAFVDAFYDRERHLFKDRVGSGHVSLPANSYAAFFGLFPEKEGEDRVVEWIGRTGFATSLLFQFYPMLGFLVRKGEGGLLHRLVSDPKAWYSVVANGGTRSPEAWPSDLKWNTSLFHLTLASVAVFLTDWNAEKAFDFPAGE